MATWIDKLREWNYDLAPVAIWLWDTVEYQAVRHGPIAYVVAIGVVIGIFLAFPPTRRLTQTICGGIYKMVLAFIMLVLSNLVVQFVAFMARTCLTLFHKARIWLTETVRRARE